MIRGIRWTCAMVLLGLLVGMMNVGPSEAVSGVQHALEARYPLSRIEVQNQGYTGAVIARGAVLTVDADGVPAHRFRVVQANTKSPRFHVRDYARVEVTASGVLEAGWGDFTLPKGSQLVVLDLKVEADRVRLFTHTARPIRLDDGASAYGCTEFVFRLDPAAMAGGDAARIGKGIERWLPFAA